MILEQKNLETFGKEFKNLTIRSKCWLKCDYCGKIFQRDKKSRQRLNQNIDKDGCGGKECSQKKREEINLNKYGVKNCFESKEIKDKIKDTNLKKYGTEDYFDSDDFREKRKETLQSKYGVDSPLQNEEIRLKIEKTCLERYGVKNYSQAEDFDRKRKETCLEKYGVDSPTKTKEVLDKRKITNQEKYGADNYAQTAEYWERRKETCLERYGVEHPHQSEEIRNKCIETSKQRYGVEYYSQLESSKVKYKNLCLEKYGVPSTLCIPENRVYGKKQEEIADWINSYNFNFVPDYKLLEGKEIDLYDESSLMAIEFNGLYCHNEASPEPRFDDYHHHKYKSCLEKNVTLLTIFEDEWDNKKDICKSIILSKLNKSNYIIHGRKCTINEIDKNTSNKFCNENHLLEAPKNVIVSFGIYFDGELMGLISLGHHPRKTNKKQICINRVCFRKYTKVHGGNSKLLKHLIEWCKNNKYNEVITWSDNRWGTGKVYEKIGFVLDQELQPDYSYVNVKKPYERLSKQSQKKSNTGCPTEMTEREWAEQNGLARIWDCGKKRWVVNF